MTHQNVQIKSNICLHLGLGLAKNIQYINAYAIIEHKLTENSLLLLLKETNNKLINIGTRHNIIWQRMPHKHLICM